MTVQLTLPKDDLLATGLTPEDLRADLDAAWSDRSGAVNGDQVFRDIAAKSESLRARGK